MCDSKGQRGTVSKFTACATRIFSLLGERQGYGWIVAASGSGRINHLSPLFTLRDTFIAFAAQQPQQTPTWALGFLTSVTYGSSKHRLRRAAALSTLCINDQNQRPFGIAKLGWPWLSASR